MTDESDVKAATIRLPTELWAWYKHRSVDNRRSLNAEILTMLEHVKHQEEAKHAQTA